VTRALLRVCNDVAWFCDQRRRRVVRTFVETLLSDVSTQIRQPADRDPLLATGQLLLDRLENLDRLDNLDSPATGTIDRTEEADGTLTT
jgi:uncharacterized membrane protein